MQPELVSPKASNLNFEKPYFFENDQTIRWESKDKKVCIIAHPYGRKDPSRTYPQYERGHFLEKMIENAKIAKEKGEGIFSQTIARGIWPINNQSFNWHVVFDRRLTKIVTSFTRYPQAEEEIVKMKFDPDREEGDDDSTPFNSVLSKQMIENAGLYLSSFGLPPDSYAVLHKSIIGYFHSLKTDNYNEWAEFADKSYFKPWANKHEFIEGQSSFSTVAWATFSKFILGVQESEFVDHSHVWNTLFQRTKGLPAQVLAKTWHLPQLEAYVLKQIRETREKYIKGEEIPNTILRYWLEKNTALEIIQNLPRSDWNHAVSIAKKRGIKLEEMVYLDNIFGLMIGMQETNAFTLTQIASHFAHISSADRYSLQSYQADIKECKKMVKETLQDMPPAGISRDLRWDTDIVDEEAGKTYSANKGDQLLTLAALTRHLDVDNPEKVQPFSAGPHQCPGQMAAMNWLAALTQQLAKYDFKMEVQDDPDYYVAFIMRDGGRKFKMSHPGQMEDNSSSSSEEQLLTIMF